MRGKCLLTTEAHGDKSFGFVTRGKSTSASVSMQEKVGNFLADFYSMNGLVLESRKRREHLSEKDISRNKAIMESLSKGGTVSEQHLGVRERERNSAFSF